MPKAKPRQSRRLHKFQADPSKLAELLNEAMPVGEGEQPVETFGYLDVNRKVRRIVAVYPNGWRIQINLDGKERLTSTSAKLTLRAQIGGSDA